MAPTGQDASPRHADAGRKETGFNVEAAPWEPKQAVNGSQQKQVGSLRSKPALFVSETTDVQQMQPPAGSLTGNAAPAVSIIAVAHQLQQKQTSTKPSAAIAVPKIVGSLQEQQAESIVKGRAKVSSAGLVQQQTDSPKIAAVKVDMLSLVWY